MDSNRPKMMKVIVRVTLLTVIAYGLGTALGFIVRNLVTLASIERQTSPAYGLFLIGIPMLGAGTYLAVFKIWPKVSFQKLSRYDVVCVASLTIVFLGVFLIVNGLAGLYPFE